MSDSAKYEEVNNYFKERMAESKKIAATRGREARLAAEASRVASNPPTWRSLKGAQLMAHELTHIGNRPFAAGLA